MLDFFQKKKVKFLHGNLIESEHNRYVAFFVEFLEIVSQGNTEYEVK
jgi:predicted RNase H-like HicB family nuclease